MTTPTPVLMPRLGETVVEGTVARWFKAAGDSVAKLEPLLAISTDKIDTEVPAPASGTLLEIRVAEGATVATGTVLALIGAPGDAAAPIAVATAVAPAAHDLAASMLPVAPLNAAKPADGERPAGRDYISPVVKRLVRAQGVDIAQVAGTGLGGRITKQDILAYVALREGAPAPGSRESGSTESGFAASGAAADSILHPLTPMRRAIAQHMVQSVGSSPHVATIFEVDMTAVVRHREAHKGEFAARGITLNYTPYFVAAAAAALRAHPLLNSRYTDGGILQARHIHIGVAVAVANGLLAPVVRNADNLSLAELARAIEDLVTRSRSGALLPDELEGGTFTITNHGVGGSLIGTPIINQAQAAILGVGAIVKRPVVLAQGPSLLPSADDALVIRPMCYLTLSFDHRLLDGAAADAFMRSVKGALEGGLVDWLTG